MNIAIVTAAAAALGLSTLSLQQSGRHPAGADPQGEELALSPAQAPADQAAPLLGDIPVLSQAFGGPAPASQPVTGDVDEAMLAEVLEMLAKSQGVRPYIHWRDLDTGPEEGLHDLPLDNQTLERAFEMINDALGLEGDSGLAFRIEDGLLEVASRGFIDRRERELVTYDVSTLIGADWPLEVTDESGVLVELITIIVEPNVWGGDIASIYAVGGKLFVSAPPRIHERVAWLLSQLMDAGEEEAAARERALRDFLVALLAESDPDQSSDPAVPGELLRGAELAPGSAEPAVARAVRDAIEATRAVERRVPEPAAPASEVVPGALEPAPPAEVVPAVPEAAPSEPAHLRLRAVDGRVLAELAHAGGVSRIEATEIEMTAVSLTALKANDARWETSGRAGAPRLYTIQTGDTLGSIAEQLLGAAARGSEVLRANPGLTADALAPGRVIVVPGAGQGFIGIEGAVSRPGRYQIPPVGEMTLQRLLASAGGPMPEARRVFVSRGEGEGRRLVHLLDIAALRTLGDAGVALEADDLVFVDAR